MLRIRDEERHATNPLGLQKLRIPAYEVYKQDNRRITKDRLTRTYCTTAFLESDEKFQNLWKQNICNELGYGEDLRSFQGVEIANTSDTMKLAN